MLERQALINKHIDEYGRGTTGKAPPEGFESFILKYFE